jgi:transglutaminase-like putative cysteine protease
VSTLVRPPDLQAAPEETPPPPKPRRVEGHASEAEQLREWLRVPEGWLAVLGFAMAAEALANSVAAGNWQPGLDGLPWLVGVAVVLAYLFTRGQHVNWAFWPLGLAAGFALSVRLPAAGFLPPRLGWAEQYAGVIGRLSDWAQRAMAGRITQEPMLIALGIAAVAYLWVYLSYLAGVRFRMAWLGMALLGLPLFGNVLFKQNAGGIWLTLWIAGSLLMVLSLSLYRKEKYYLRLAFLGWRRGSGGSLLGGAGMIAIATALFTAAPQVKVNDWLNQLYNRLNGPIGIAQHAYDQLGVPQQVDPGQIRVDSFQSRLPFLGPFRPGTELVMKIRSDQARYEQGMVFDHYDHDGWTNTRFNQFQTNNSDFSTLTAQETAKDKDRRQIGEEITAVRPAGALLFGAPQPVGASVRLRGDGFGDLRATQVVQPNQSYTSASLESIATIEELQAAVGPIPADVQQTYLQLPDDMPSRIRDLAQQQTAGKNTAFDKAVALEAYVRTIPYNTETPLPPPGRDGVDWFLFDSRKGYSDYSSSAMAVMLRMVGIPSRVAGGYSPGQLDASDGLYHVTERNTHTWTQAYFPGFGWIDFEPSPSDPAFPRYRNPREVPTAGSQPNAQPTIGPNSTPTPGPGAGAAAASRPTSSANGGGSPPPWWITFPWWIIGLFLAALAGLGYWLENRLGGAPGARLAYLRIAVVGTLLGQRPRSWQTPQEYGRTLQERRRFDPNATDIITSLYSADRYSGQRLDERSNRRAWNAWQYLKSRLLRPGTGRNASS